MSMKNLWTVKAVGLKCIDSNKSVKIFSEIQIVSLYLYLYEYIYMNKYKLSLYVYIYTYIWTIVGIIYSKKANSAS